MNPKSDEFKFPNIKPCPWTKVFKSRVDPLAIDLISKVLVYSPTKRLRPLEALLHPYFNELKAENCKINGNPIPDLFNFSTGIWYWIIWFIEELSTQPELAEKLVPNWYKKSKNW